MGERYSKYAGGGVHPTSEIKLNQPITITFTHDVDQSESSPKCAYWNLESHRWTTHGCKLIESNLTHSKCGCQRLATFALLAPSDGDFKNFRWDQKDQINADIRQIGGFNNILVGIMAAVILVLALVILGILVFYCRKRKVSFYIGFLLSI